MLYRVRVGCEWAILIAVQVGLLAIGGALFKRVFTIILENL